VGCDADYLSEEVVKIELIFAEFGDGAHHIDKHHYRDFFPFAEFNIIENAQSMFQRDHPRWGWRMNDYYKAFGLLHSDAAIAIALDADMRIFDRRVETIFELTKIFGLCMPVNPRRLVKVDNEIGADGKAPIPDEVGLMHAVNCGIIALDTHNAKARDCVETFLKIMEATPMRGPVAWAKAFYATGFSPCLLPAQWCVCAEDVGCGNEIVLHTGHQKVREHYATIL
jgi:hypothetical protein